MTELAGLEVLAFDCQATAPDPAKGHLLEVGFLVADDGEVTSRLARLPEGAEVPERVRRVTGISDEELKSGDEPGAIWRLVAGTASAVAAENGLLICPTVVHFASFEERHLRWLHYHAEREAPFPFGFLCTHRMASRLLPELPRKSLRAVAGYFGHALPESRRAGDHARATLGIWRSLVVLLREREGVTRLEDLCVWLREPRGGRAVRRYPMPVGAGQALPAGPGVYRMQRANGDVLYVGKATSLRDRVSSYFRSRAPHAEHTLEMLSQAKDVDFTETATALEAALFEADEIKRLEPPYNRALRGNARRLVFATPKLDHLSESPDAEHRLGPLLASETLSAFPLLLEALAGGEAVPPHLALGLPERFAPEHASFQAGLDLFRGAIGDSAPLGFGARLWRLEEDESEEAPDEFQLEPQSVPHGPPRPEAVTARASEIVRRVAHLVRRAHWHALLSESALAWRSRDGHRVALVLEGGAVQHRLDLSEAEPPPAPPKSVRPFAERRRRFDLESYDRMTVLTQEIRRLLSEGREPTLRLGSENLVESSRLERLLKWV